MTAILLLAVLFIWFISDAECKSVGYNRKSTKINYNRMGRKMARRMWK